MDNLVYKLSHPDSIFAMNRAIPGMTSAWILDHVHDRLSNICDKKTEIFESSNHAAAAAHAQAFMNGAIGVKMPSCKDWLCEYSADTETAQLCELVTNLSKINNKTLGKVNHNYRGPLRRLHIIIEGNMLVLKDHMHGKGSYIKLQLVPEGLRNIISIAFHSNPIGGHFNAYCTFYQIKLRSTGQACTLILPICARNARGARFERPPNKDRPSSSTVSPLKHLSKSCILMAIWQEGIIVSKETSYIFLHVAACALLQ